MDSEAIIAVIAKVIQVAVDMGPEVIKDATPFAETIYNNLFKGQTATDADATAVEAQLAVLSAQLQAPLPEGGA